MMHFSERDREGAQHMTSVSTSIGKGNTKDGLKGPYHRISVQRIFGGLSYVIGSPIHNHVQRRRKWQERKRCCKEGKEGVKGQEIWRARAWSMEAKEKKDPLCTAKFASINDSPANDRRDIK